MTKWNLFDLSKSSETVHVVFLSGLNRQKLNVDNHESGYLGMARCFNVH